VIAASVLWGTTGTAAAFAPVGANAVSIGAARIVFGGVLLFALAAKPVVVLGRTGGNSTRVQLAFGSIAVAAYQVCFFSAVANTGVAIGTVVALGSAPVLTGLLAWALRRESLTWRWAVATVAAISGCLVLLVSDGQTTEAGRVGIGLAVLAGLSYACYALVASRLIIGGVHERTVMGALFGGGALLLVPVLVATSPGWLFQARGLLAAAHLAVLATLVGYLLYGRGLRTTPVAVASTLTLTEPAVAAVLGVLVLGEQFTWANGTGIALIGSALLGPDPGSWTR
jgi:DME family drug/metabolite transporter